MYWFLYGYVCIVVLCRLYIIRELKGFSSLRQFLRLHLVKSSEKTSKQSWPLAFPINPHLSIYFTFLYEHFWVVKIVIISFIALNYQQKEYARLARHYYYYLVIKYKCLQHFWARPFCKAWTEPVNETGLFPKQGCPKGLIGELGQVNFQPMKKVE